MKGTYVLLIRVPENVEIRVGALGILRFDAGEYAYVGSAYGPGGIEARVKRHLRAEKKIRWHIDHLLEHAEVDSVLIKECVDEGGRGNRMMECPYIPGFGSSDSPLPSHLFMCPHSRVREIFPDFQAFP